MNVKIIGIGPGFSFPYDGPTHHGTQDIYLLYLIPEFEIYNISDNNLANEFSNKINKFKGPTYIRIDKGNLNYNQNIKYNLDKGYEIIFKSIVFEDFSSETIFELQQAYDPDFNLIYEDYED